MRGKNNKNPLSPTMSKMPGKTINPTDALYNIVCEPKANQISGHIYKRDIGVYKYITAQSPVSNLRISTRSTVIHTYTKKRTQTTLCAYAYMRTYAHKYLYY